MLDEGRRPARALGSHRLFRDWAQGFGDGALPQSRGHRCHRGGAAIRSGLELLESRTMLSGTQGPISGPVSAVPEGPMLNLVLEPSAGGSLGSLAGVITRAGGTVEATGMPGYFLVQAPAAAVGPLEAQLTASPAVEYVAAPRTVQVADAPNNPSYDNNTQWYLDGPFGINAPGAWNITTGSTQVIVADTDTGISYNNPQMLNNLWINQAEIPSSVQPNLTDTNGDGLITLADLNAVVGGTTINQGPGKIEPTTKGGLVTGGAVIAPTSSGGWSSGSTQDGDTAHPDDLIGWSFVNNNNNPIDQNGHGTFTAGEIAAVGNNGAGVTGALWSVQIMGLQFLDSGGNGSDTAAALAIEYAVNHGARVINASWGGTGQDPVIASAIQYADQNGVILVCAAGNSSTNNDNSSTWFTPASYSLDYPNVIAVAATDINGNLAGYSDFGVQSVQIAAPGSGLYGVGLNNTYTTDSGTSMAAPLVTGTVALVEAAHPTWSMAQVIDAVVDTATPDAALAGRITSGGIVNAAAAISNTNGPYVVSSSASSVIAGGTGFSSIEVTFNEEINPATFTASQVSLTAPGGSVSGISVAAVPGSNDHTFDISFPNQSSAGAYTLQVGPDIQDWYGNDMNQNRNGTNGEATADQFTETIERASGTSSDVFLLSVANVMTAGTGYNLTVTAIGPGGGIDTGFVGTINFKSSDPKMGIQPPSANFTAASKGTLIFGMSFKTPGDQSITAYEPAAPAVSGTESNILVSPAAAKTLVISDSGIPTAGVPFPVTVTALDPYGNVATGYTGTIKLSSSDSAASLPVTYNGNVPAAPVPATYTFAPEQQGAGTFYVTFGTSGAQSLTATDSKTSTITGTASGLAVQAGTGALGNADATTTTFASPVGTSASGQTVTLSTTVKATTSGVANPTDGAVTFYQGSTFLGTVNLSGSDLATFTTGPLSAGTYQFFAVYGGDTATYMPSASSVFTQVVNHFATNLALALSSPTSSSGQSVTFTATASVVGSSGATSPVPGGTVTFYDGTTALVTTSLNGSLQATFTTSALVPGTHFITAVYNGDSLTQTNQSPTLTETVAPTSQSVVYVNSAFAGDANGTQIAIGGGITVTMGVNAFATIQAGIDGVASGGTVNVMAGTYAEQLSIGESLTLSGAGTSTTFLSAPSAATGGSQIAINGGPSVSVTVSGLTISGSLLLTGIADDFGASLNATSIVSSGDDIGISVEGGSIATISGSSITGDNTGIWLANAGAATVTHSAINGCATGILVGNGGGDVSTLTAQQDDLSGNLTGVEDVQSATVSTAPAAVVTSDWWGSLHGPTNATANPGGAGSGVSGNVTFSPWIGVYTPGSGTGFYPTVSALYAVPTQLVFVTEPSSPDNFGVAFTTQPAIEAEDASGNLGINFDYATTGAQVNLALVAGAYTGTLSGTATQNASSGVATFNGLSITHAGVYTLTASALPVGDPWSSLITTDPVSTSITVSQATPTVHESAPSSGTYTGSVFAATATVAGVNNVFSSSLEGVSPTLTYYVGTGTAGANLGSSAPRNAGTYTVVANFAGSTDYTPASSAASTFTISQEALTITAVANSKVYDGTTSAAAIPSITQGSILSGDTANFIETYNTPNVGTGLTLTPSGTVADGNSGNNYAYTFVPVSTGVITASGTTAVFDQADTGTKGNWINVYGNQGYDVVGSGVINPTYATITPCRSVALHVDAGAGIIGDASS